MFGDGFFVNCGFQLYRFCQTLDVDFANVFRYFFTKFHLNNWPRGLVSPTSFPGSLMFPKRDPGLGWSRVFQILADSTDVIEGRGLKVKVCLALSLPTEPSRE